MRCAIGAANSTEMPIRNALDDFVSVAFALPDVGASSFACHSARRHLLPVRVVMLDAVIAGVARRAIDDAGAVKR